MANPNELFIPTARRVLVEDDYVIGQRLQNRLLCAADYCDEHQEELEQNGGAIIIAGGYSYRNGDPAITDPAQSESGLGEQFLRTPGSHAVSGKIQIRTQTTAGTLYGAVGRAVEEGILDPDDYTGDYPLGVVAPRFYFPRVAMVLAAAGVKRNALVNVPVANESASLTEPLLRMLAAEQLRDVANYTGLIALDSKIVAKPPRRWMRRPDSSATDTER